MQLVLSRAECRSRFRLGLAERWSRSSGLASHTRHTIKAALELGALERKAKGSCALAAG